MALWDSGVWDTAKWSTIEATISVTLDDIAFAGAGQDVHVATIALALDDIAVSSAGTVTHNGTLALTTDSIIFDATGKHIEVDDFRLQLDDIAVNIDAYIVQTFVPTKGGYKPKQKKVKNERVEVEKAVEQAVNKALGIVEPEDIVEQVEEVKQPEIDYTAQINELMLEAQAKALGISIEQYLIDSELDDEETILLFI